MDPVRELPYGPAASGAASEAGQMAASDHVQPFKKPLASHGASTDGKLCLVSPSQAKAGCVILLRMRSHQCLQDERRAVQQLIHLAVK